MKPLYNEKTFEITKSTEILPCECYHCKEVFYKSKKEITYEIKNNRGAIKFCSRKCRDASKITKKNIICNNCNENFEKISSKVKNVNFCSKSCAATYNNTHKKHGTRRSKLEKYLEEKLLEIYPNIKIDFNKKDAINSELDIYIPSLKLAFELNGIYHYEPIHGSDKLSKIQNNDNRKFQACAEQGISLCIIDTSSQSYFKENTSEKFFKIIIDIINSK
jgi:hypothetical protein